MENNELARRDFCSVVDDITKSMSSVRETIRSLREKQSNSDALDTKDGISLLSLKHQLLLSYLQSLTILTARRALGHSLSERSPPLEPFSSTERGQRGGNAGDLVDSMVEARVVLEKVNVLENKMRYQIEKLVKLAQSEQSSSNTVVDDPLAFRPNPQDMMDNENEDIPADNEDHPEQDVPSREELYRPPKLAPMPYAAAPKDKKARRKPLPSALAALAHQDPSRPPIESTTGLATLPSLTSNRANEIRRMTEFEEENFTRLVMKKKDAKQRRRDEGDIALGGTGGITGRRRVGGFDEEFADVLKSVDRSRTGVVGDGYEELRKRGKRADLLVRARTRTHDMPHEDDSEGLRPRKKSRFEKETKLVKRKMLKRSKK